MKFQLYLWCFLLFCRDIFSLWLLEEIFFIKSGICGISLQYIFHEMAVLNVQVVGECTLESEEEGMKERKAVSQNMQIYLFIYFYNIPTTQQSDWPVG